MNFAHLYKSAAETNVRLLTTQNKVGKSKRKKMKSNLVTPNTEDEMGDNNTDENQPINNASNKKARKKDKVKSVSNNSESVINAENGDIKPKKRNKSVSFMLDDKEEVVVKKTKSDITTYNEKSTNNDENNTRKQKKNKKPQDGAGNDDVEINKRDITSNLIEKTINLKRIISEKLDNDNSDLTKRKTNKKVKKTFKGKESGDNNAENINLINKTQETNENKKKKKQHKEIKVDVGTSTTDKESSVEIRKSKKKKHLTTAQNNESEIEADKSNSSENKPEVIAGTLKNLSIGDNTHTISNLLDEMTVVDKKKKKKNKLNKIKNKKLAQAVFEIEGGKEKEKWQNKRWNKGKKGKDDPDKGLHPVNIENLPLSIILTYKKLLAEHFAQCGTVRRIGIAQIYPSESTKPLFNTTVYFDNAADATKALEEDNTSIQGSTIRVLRPYPATETTAVVRTYGPLTEQILSTMFSNVGRIRRIRYFMKGKKSMSSSFVELDEPEAVERAIKMADEIRVGGKKVHVSKFQLQHKPKKEKKEHNTTDKVEEKKPAVNDEDSDGDDLDD